MSTTEQIVDSVINKHDKAGDLQNLNAQSAAKMFDEIHDLMKSSGSSGNNEATMKAIAARMDKDLGDKGVKVGIQFEGNDNGKLDKNDKLLVTEKGTFYNSVSKFPVVELFDSAKDAPAPKAPPKPEKDTGSRAEYEHGSMGFSRAGDTILKPIRPEK